jgi:Cd2+/Zn2+-exporting ATPase
MKRPSRVNLQLAAAFLAGLALASGWALHFAAPESPALSWVLMYVSLGIGIIFGGAAAAQALRERRLDIEALMVVAAVLAAIVGHPDEGALLLFLFLLSAALEGLAKAKTTRAVSALHAIMPVGSLRWEDGDWVRRLPEELHPGDRIRIRGGEQAPTDGVLTEGETEFDQAAITGEAMPRVVGPGDELFAGTINCGGAVEMRVTRAAEDSSLQHVLRLVTEAQAQRPPMQQLIDRIGGPYSKIVLFGSMAMFLVWCLLPPEWGGLGWRDALYRAIVLLIVASPCALIIATPTATLAALSCGARRGVLFKGGQALARLAHVQAVALDKTGTLTHGRPSLVRIMHVHGDGDDAQILGLAAGLEVDSSHPIALALLEAADARGIQPEGIRFIEHHTGQGVSGLLDGDPIRLGGYSFVVEMIDRVDRERVRDLLAGSSDAGDISVVIAWRQSVAVLVLRDTVRPGAHELGAALRSVGVSRVVMVTGDSAATAERVASTLDLGTPMAELLPAQKVEVVHRLRRDVGRTAVIGDGINDTPALAAADVGIAIGSIGVDAPKETADIVLLAEDLRAAPWAIGLANRAQRTITLNILVALLAIVLMIILTLQGRLTMSWGVIGHEGGTLLVVLNSLRLLATPGEAWQSKSGISGKKRSYTGVDKSVRGS